MSDPKLSPRQELAAKLLMAGFSLLLTLLAFEVALRVMLPGSLNPFEPDAEIGFRLKAGFDGAYPRVPVVTDEHRRRLPVGMDRSPSGRVLFVGDSVTFGFGVNAEETFAYRFGELRGVEDHVAVVAVPGYNLAQTVAILREQLELQRPDLVVYGLSVNDIGGASRLVTFADIDPHRNRMEGGGILSRSMLVAFLNRRFQRIGVYFGWVERVDGSAADDIFDIERELDPEDLAAFRTSWEEFDRLLADAGVPTWTLISPLRSQVEGRSETRALQEYAAALCAESWSRCLNPLPMLRAAGEPVLFNGDSQYHFNPRGHELLAEFLHRELPVEVTAGLAAPVTDH